MSLRLFVCLCVLSLFAVRADATEYFVRPGGDDANDGLSREAAFATVQRGVEALEPGDTLTIAPGEYSETVRREGIGGPDAATTIRAEIPGTVTLRGDVPAPEFTKVEEYRYVYVADFDDEAHVVNELDTLSVLESVPNVDELEFSPGHFHQDLEDGKLYLSATDLASANDHRYTVTVSGTHGIYLRDAERVKIEGINVTGFNRHSYRERGDGDHGATFGIFLMNGRDCVIRDCRAFFNGRGIGLSSVSEDSGGNVIEQCVAWANSSRYGGTFGGLTLYQPRRDVIRDSVAFRNGHKGVNIRVTGDFARLGEDALSRLVGNLSWGNNIDIRIKAAASGHIAERNVAVRAIEYFESIHNTLGVGIGTGSDRLQSEDTILLSAKENVIAHEEFADPDNFDFRLQATSRFRGTGPGGSDRGAYPYEHNIFYVKPDGSNAADGRSIATAWRTLDRAARQLRPGDTLYLEGGVYDGNLSLSGGLHDFKPISIRGRGVVPVVIRGDLVVRRGRWIEFERLTFDGEVRLSDSRDIAFNNCRFVGEHSGVRAELTNGLRFTHCEFPDIGRPGVEASLSERVFLRGNIFDNQNGPAVRIDRADAILYSDYNAYRSDGSVWEIGGDATDFEDLQADRDRYSRILTPEFASRQGSVKLENLADFSASGGLGKPFGVYSAWRRDPEDELRVDGPHVHSASATTANIEWWSSRPAVFTVRWGLTEALAEEKVLTPTIASHPGSPLEPFNTFSLTGLRPDTEYFFRIAAVRGEEDEPIQVAGAEQVFEPITFTTAVEDPEPSTYHVAPGGDNANSGLSPDEAWATVVHAAAQVAPGDTVLIHGGQYREFVRMRATGAEGAPISFRAAPGEKVMFDGHGKRLAGAFSAANKAHLRFDGMYFGDFARRRLQGLFRLNRSRDIHISRCFHDGRNRGTEPEFVTAGQVDDLLIENCVVIRVWDILGAGSPSGWRIENNVFVLPAIRSLILNNPSDTVVRSNIFTDNLAVKQSAFLVRPHAGAVMENNAFFLRTPEEERSVFGGGADGMSLAEYNAEYGVAEPNVVADPIFAVFAAQAQEAGEEPEPRHFSDGMLSHFQDFPDLFTTNPELVERGIGLQPEAFEDFHFNQE